MFLQLQTIGLGARGEHPNAAKLFIDWLLDDEGQQQLAAVDILPGKPEAFQQAAAYLGGTRLLPIQPEVAARAGDDLDQWRQIMGIQ